MNREAYSAPEYLQIYETRGEIISHPDDNICLLRRSIPKTTYFDCCNIYPFISLKSYGTICQTLDLIKRDSISATIVTNPLYPITTSVRRYFEFVKAYKTHHILELHSDMISDNHKRNIKKFYKRNAIVSISTNRVETIDPYYELYAELMDRRKIADFSNFTKAEMRGH